MIPAFGTSLQSSDVAFLLQDMLNGMGDFMTQEIGSLNWCEAFTNARALAAAKQYAQLLANQLSPNSSSVYLNRWAQMYNTLGLSNPQAIENFIEIKQALFGTPPTLSNIDSFMNYQLGQMFINIQWAPELQILATTDPLVQITEDGYAYRAPLCDVYVYVWQPRDNQDNLLMPTNFYNANVESYRQIMEPWNPSYITFITYNLNNRGFQDGYGNGYNGLNYNNYQDGYNVVSGTAGSTSIVGTGTAFQLYPNGSPGDFIYGVEESYYPPIQIVDDNNVLQTYYVESVTDNTHLTITTPLINNITNRTYRTIGFVLDSPSLDDVGLFSF